MNPVFQEGLRHPVGTVVSFTCSSGYRLTSLLPLRCQDSESWSRTQPKCRVIRCRSFRVAEGRLIPQQNSYATGSTVSIECNEGFRLNGTNSRSCSQSGDWVGEIPGCTDIDNYQLVPDPCSTSSVNGYQRLRNNKKGVCDDGWTVFQRRFNGSVDFNRTWQEYKDGFGNMEGEFWLGLDKIHELTSGQNCKLKVKMTGFDAATAYAQYSSFAIDDESDNYRLHVSGFSGTAGDSFALHNGMQFTTKDRDNDRVTS
uniref:Ficolin-1-like n=1 Tax=Phallusia mammillata TaxID=59560 RepID=A0A6F9DCP8_9ASCI|nr:ficolin-1-like [Phallusia mammillata]